MQRKGGVVTKDEIDALLAKLTRYTDGGDYEGGYMMHERPDGMYVEFDDVHDLLQSIHATAIEECAKICEKHASNALDDETYSLGTACAAEIRGSVDAPQTAG
jgi:hypothetical protein